MPFHGPHHSSSSSTQHNASAGQAGAASGLYQAAQALGSIGAPTGNLRVATSGTTSAGTDSLFPGSGNAPGLSGQPAPPVMAGPGVPNPAPSSAAQNPQHFESPRRAQSYRQGDELHIPSMSQHGSHQQPISGQQMYHSPQEYSTGGVPGINLQQATSQGAQYSNASSGSTLPSTLQPGGLSSGRPGALSTNTAPPTMHQLATQQQQQYPPSRSGTFNNHSHSRSSPSGFDNQKYVSTPSSLDSPKYMPHKYTAFHGQQSPAPNSAPAGAPLGLADIRPRTDTGTSDPGANLNPYSYDGNPALPTNSNYLAPWAIYAFDWCKWPVQQQAAGAGKVAVGSYLEDGHNFIQILDTHIVPQSTSEPTPPGIPSHGLEFTKLAEATHSYPVTRILWEPPSSQKQSTDLLATSGDHLRLWSLPASSSNTSNSITTRSPNSRDQALQKLTPLALLSNSKSPEHTAPLTSLDWNTLSPSLIITSSIDTTCTIWDIPTLTAKTQLIAHDKEVYDVRFCANSVDVFVSCGADGSVRMFDLRSLEHSTIIYEPTTKPDEKVASPGNLSPATQQTMNYAPPLLRLAASPHDAHLLATFSQDSNIIRILDVRQPGQALLELRGHASAINCMEWSPSRRGMLASGADDSLVLIWDLLNQSNSAAPTHGQSINGVIGGQSAQATAGADNGRAPAASWTCDYEVGNISWAPQSSLTSQGEWLGVSGGRGVWGVKL
ncbi:MAG: hypothetical protein M1813_004780 [Trichoglossum hirsutum]|nr:MAG: hypothetical protein M1813_004780 [Trichoglossum hirsutum]